MWKEVQRDFPPIKCDACEMPRGDLSEENRDAWEIFAETQNQVTLTQEGEWVGIDQKAIWELIDRKDASGELWGAPLETFRRVRLAEDEFRANQNEKVRKRQEEHERKMRHKK